MTRFRILENTFQESLTYTGTELRPHWGLEKTGVYGSLLTCFVGPCEVQTGDLVDMEDQLQNDFIRSKKMLHIIGEFFGDSLTTAVYRQRLLITWCRDLLLNEGVDAERIGDDLFCNGKKMSVSIATISPVSTLVHWGINLDASGAPVAAIGFYDLGWDDSQVLSFAKKLLSHYIEEIHDIERATFKVRPVH